MPIRGGESRSWERGRPEEVASTTRDPGPLGRFLGKKPQIIIETRDRTPVDRGEVEESYDPGVVDMVRAFSQAIRDLPRNALSTISPRNIRDRAVRQWVERNYGESIRKRDEAIKRWHEVRDNPPNHGKERTMVKLVKQFREGDENGMLYEIICKSEGRGFGGDGFAQIAKWVDKNSGLYGLDKGDRQGVMQETQRLKKKLEELRRKEDEIKRRGYVF